MKKLPSKFSADLPNTWTMLVFIAFIAGCFFITRFGVYSIDPLAQIILINLLAAFGVILSFIANLQFEKYTND